jgi:ketosteroid isomerase-like protein
VGQKFDLLVAMNDAVLEKRWDDVAAVLHPSLAAWAPTYDVHSSSAWLSALRQQNQGLEDVQVQLNLVVETDDVVVYESEWSIPNHVRGGRAVLRAMSVFEFDGGRVRALRQYWDGQSFYSQFSDLSGVTPDSENSSGGSAHGIP